MKKILFATVLIFLVFCLIGCSLDSSTSSVKDFEDEKENSDSESNTAKESDNTGVEASLIPDCGVKIRYNPAPAESERAYNACGDNLTWSLDENGTLVISGEGDMWDFEKETEPWLDLNINKVVVTDGVTSIGRFDRKRYNSSYSHMEIYIPESVTSVHPYVFATFSFATVNSPMYKVVDDVIFSADMKEIVYYPYWKAGTSYEIPEGVTKIGDYAFYNIGETGSGTMYVSQLLKLTIPDGVEYIGNYAFKSLALVKEFKLPDSVKYIGDYAFYDCEFAESINIPQGTKFVGDCAFVACSSLKEIYIPSSVESFGYFGSYSDLRAFCPSQYGKGGSTTQFDVETIFSEITVDTNNKNYCSVDGVLFNKDKTKLLHYPIRKQGREYTVPNTVETIDKYAFYGNRYLNEIIIPDSVKTINEHAFSNTSLKDIELGNNVEVIEHHAFSNTGIESVVLPDSLKKLGDYAFTSISSLYIPPTLTDFDITTLHFEDYLGFMSMPSITIHPDNPKYIIEDGVIFNKDKTELFCFNNHDVKEYYIPDSVTKIASSAFGYGTFDLKKIYFTKNITHVSDNFGGWDSMYEICGDLSGLEYIEKNAFTSSKFSVDTLLLPNLKFLGERAFAWTKLKSIIITSENFESVEKNVFDFLNSELEYVIIGNDYYNEDNIDDMYSKYGKTQTNDTLNNNINVNIDLSNIVFKEFTKTDEYGIVYSTDGKMIFSTPSKLDVDNFSIPEGVVAIGPYAFSNSNFYNVTLPESLEYIGNGAFNYCENLEHVIIPENVKITGDCAFGYCNNLKTATVKGNIEYMADFLFYTYQNPPVVELEEGIKYIGNYNSFKISKIPEGLEYLGQTNIDENVSVLRIPKTLKSFSLQKSNINNSLQKYIVDDENEYYSSDNNGVLFNKDKTELIHCPPGAQLYTYTVPDTVTTISDYAFSGNQYLEVITIPESVTEIADRYALQKNYNNPYKIQFFGTEEQWNKINSALPEHSKLKNSVTFID